MSQPTSPTHPRRRRALRCSLAAAALTLALAGSVTAARAEVSATAQAVADDGTALPYIPAPAQRAGMCLIDTGVNLNPDTEGEVVYRGAIDDGTGNDLSPDQHGTIMAMMAAAPPNKWGMTGTAPQAIQIISIRILRAGQTSFPFSAYASGISECLRLGAVYDIRTINLSLGSSEVPSGESYEAVGDAIQEAENYGIAVVAGAGNDDGGPVAYPAAYPSVLAVAASNTVGGGFCSFSNRGEGVLLAPGCNLDGADPSSGVEAYDYWQGSSEASAITDAALTALLAYKPTITAQEGEQDLRQADNGTLDIAQTFRNAGLSEILAEGEAAEPHPAPPTVSSSPAGAAMPVGEANHPNPVPASTAMNLTTPFPKPAAKLKRIKRHLTLLLSGRPAEARTEVRYLGYDGHPRRLVLLKTLRGTFAALAIPSGVAAVSARYTDPYDIHRSSAWITLKPPGPPPKAARR